MAEEKHHVFQNSLFSTKLNKRDEGYLIHVLDKGNGAYKTVTNNIDHIAPYLYEVYGIKSARFICYGTDGVVAEFNPEYKSFRMVKGDLIDQGYQMKMQLDYGVSR